MKRYITATMVVVVLALAGTAVAAPKDKEPKEDKKVTICHATSSDSNPWVRTVVSENATAGHFENNGTAKAGHEGDKLLEGDVACPLVVVTEPPVVVTPPKDEGKEDEEQVEETNKEATVTESRTAPATSSEANTTPEVFSGK